MIKIILVIISFFFSSSIDTLYFKSANPFSFRDIIKKLDKQKEQEVYGILTLPENINPNEKVPLINGPGI